MWPMPLSMPSRRPACTTGAAICHQRWYSSARCAMFLDAAWDGLEVLGKFDRNPWESMRNQCFCQKKCVSCWFSEPYWDLYSLGIKQLKIGTCYHLPCWEVIRRHFVDENEQGQEPSSRLLTCSRAEIIGFPAFPLLFVHGSWQDLVLPKAHNHSQQKWS